MNSEDEERMFSPGAMMFSPNLTLNELNNMTRPCTTLCSGEEIKKPPPKRRKVSSRVPKCRVRGPGFKGHRGPAMEGEGSRL